MGGLVRILGGAVFDRAGRGRASVRMADMTQTAVTKECDAEVPAVEAIRRGDRCACGSFLRRHESWVRGVIFGVLGEREGLDDVCQQAWTRVWEQIGSLRDVRRWRSWLYRVARSSAVDAGREVSRRRRIGSATSNGEAMARLEAPGGKGDGVWERERRGIVLDAIRSLPAIYREPFVLRHLEGWSYERIGEVMGLPEDTVETRLVRARRLLREALQGKV